MAQKEIFRQEAVNHQRSKWAGKALLISGLPALAIACISAVFIIALLTFLIFGNYTRRINVSGEVTTLPRSVNIFAAQQGFISQRFLNVGDQVKKGQRLYQIDVSRVTDSGVVSANTRQAIESQVAQIDSIIQKLQANKRATVDNLSAQKAQYEIAHKQSQQLVENSRRGVESMRRTMDSYGEYQRRGLINKDQRNNQSYLYYQQQSAFQNLYSQSIQESLQIANLGSDIGACQGSCRLS